MDTDSGRDPSGSGSHPSGHAAYGVDGASRVDPSRIPSGPYCYASLSRMDANGRFKINGQCPYWERRGNDNAFCRYLNVEDAILLWDQVKICGVRDEMDWDAIAIEAGTATTEGRGP